MGPEMSSLAPRLACLSIYSNTITLLSLFLLYRSVSILPSLLSSSPSAHQKGEGEKFSHPPSLPLRGPTLVVGGWAQVRALVALVSRREGPTQSIDDIPNPTHSRAPRTFHSSPPDP